MRTRIAVIAQVKARKNGSQAGPCGVAAPKYSITGMCQHPQRRPSKMAGGSQVFAGEIIFGKAKPVQPISSKKPATRPNPAPGKKRLGANAGETKVFREKRAVKTKRGGMRSAAYQRSGNFQRATRWRRSRRPARPSKI